MPWLQIIVKIGLIFREVNHLYTCTQRIYGRYVRGMNNKTIQKYNFVHQKNKDFSVFTTREVRNCTNHVVYNRGSEKALYRNIFIIGFPPKVNTHNKQNGGLNTLFNSTKRRSRGGTQRNRERFRTTFEMCFSSFTNNVANYCEKHTHFIVNVVTGKRHKYLT